MRYFIVWLLLSLMSDSFSQTTDMSNQYSQGKTQFNNGNIREALAIFEKIYAIDSTETLALEYMAIINGQLHQYGKAANGYAKLTKWFPQEASYYSNACFYYTLANQPVLAERFGEKAVSLDGYRYNHMLNLAHTYLLQYDEQKSIYWYMRALQWVPSKAAFERAFLGDFRLIDSLKLMPSDIVKQFVAGLTNEASLIDYSGKATRCLDSILSYLDKKPTTLEDQKILQWKRDFIEAEAGAKILRTNVAGNFATDLGMYEYNKRNRSMALNFYFEKAENIFKASEDSLSHAQLLLAITKQLLIVQQVENKYGKNNDALYYASKALTQVENTKITELKSLALHLLSEAYFQQDQNEQGLQCLHQLLQWSLLREDKGYFWATNGLANHHANHGNLDSALLYQNLCLAGIEIAGLTSEQIAAIKLNHLDLLYSKGQYRQVLTKAAAMSVDIEKNAPVVYSDLCELMGECYRALSLTDSAYYYYKTSVHAFIAYSNKMEKKQTGNIPVQVTERRMNALRQLCRITATKNDKSDFFYWAEMSKDNYLRYLVSNEYQPETIISLQKAQQSLPADAAAIVYVANALVPSPFITFTNSNSKIDSIDSYSVLQQIKSFGLEKTFSTLLKQTNKKALTTEDSVGSVRLLALMHFTYLSNINPGAARSVINYKRNDDSAHAQLAAEKIRLAKLLYTIYIKPMAPLLAGKNTLYISADLMQHFIPFETLIMDDGRFLGEAYDIIYTPGFTIRDFLAKRSYNAGSSIVVAGNPDYNTYHPEKLTGRAFDFTSMGLTSWSDLPGTRQEIATLQSSFDSVTVYSGSQLSETALKQLSASGNLNNAAILHFTLHGMAGTTIAKEDNSLVVTEPDGGEEDGLLQFDEAYALDIKPQLVCLSACETALGMIDNDGSLSSMATAFLAGGAKAVLATNWSVSDDATAVFMKDVYGQVKQTGIGFAKAVANTKRKFIAGEFGALYSRPFYWAPFKYIGN